MLGGSISFFSKLASFSTPLRSRVRGCRRGRPRKSGCIPPATGDQAGYSLGERQHGIAVLRCDLKSGFITHVGLRISSPLAWRRRRLSRNSERDTLTIG